MPSLEAIERVVIDTFSAASGHPPASRDTAVLDLIDSVGLIIALADVQATLDVELESDEIIEVFQCRSLGDVAAALHAALAGRVTAE